MYNSNNFFIFLLDVKNTGVFLTLTKLQHDSFCCSVPDLPSHLNGSGKELLLKSHSEACQHLKYFRNVDCV